MARNKTETETINFVKIEPGDTVMLPDGKYARLRHIVSTPCEVKIPRMQYLTTYDIVDKEGNLTGDHRTVSLTDTDNVEIIKRVPPSLYSRIKEYLFGT